MNPTFSFSQQFNQFKPDLGFWTLRLRLVRVKVFPENRYFPKMLFSGKENVFMCLVAFQKMFRKIFFDVWLCSWKYHRKHIFYLLLTFSQLPNEYVLSFIPKNTNKTQKRSHFLGEIAIAISPIENTFSTCYSHFLSYQTNT